MDLTFSTFTMHHEPVKDSEGTFEAWKSAGTIECHKCNKAGLFYRLWESACGGYEDIQYKCRECGASWWVDGIDS